MGGRPPGASGAEQPVLSALCPSESARAVAPAPGGVQQHRVTTQPPPPQGSSLGGAADIPSSGVGTFPVPLPRCTQPGRAGSISGYRGSREVLQALHFPLGDSNRCVANEKGAKEASSAHSSAARGRAGPGAPTQLPAMPIPHSSLGRTSSTGQLDFCVFSPHPSTPGGCGETPAPAPATLGGRGGAGNASVLATLSFN